jgi:hypothetical protein
MNATRKTVGDGESCSQEETARRRDEVVRRMANTPPQPRVMPLGHRPGKKNKAASGHAAGKRRADRER